MTMMAMMLSSTIGRNSRRSLPVNIRSIRCASSALTKEEKAAEKEIRKQRYEAAQERLKRLKTRRGAVDVKKADFRGWFDKRRIFQEIMDRKARQEKLDWKINVAVVIERLPIVLPDMEPWEKDYLELKEYLDKFSWDYPEEINLEDEKVDEFAEPVQQLPRETAADASGDYHTLDRRLKTRIYYAHKQTEDSKWGFPTTDLEPEETLRAAAERVAKATLGDEAEIISMYNCPVAVDLEVKKEDGFYGTKTFFMKIQYFRGPTIDPKDVVDYGWLERSELTSRAEEDEGPNAAKFFRYML